MKCHIYLYEQMVNNVSKCRNRMPFDSLNLSTSKLLDLLRMLAAKSPKVIWD